MLSYYHAVEAPSQDSVWAHLAHLFDPVLIVRWRRFGRLRLGDQVATRRWARLIAPPPAALPRTPQTPRAPRSRSPPIIVISRENFAFSPDESLDRLHHLIRPRQRRRWGRILRSGALGTPRLRRQTRTTRWTRCWPSGVGHRSPLSATPKEVGRADWQMRGCRPGARAPGRRSRRRSRAVGP